MTMHISLFNNDFGKWFRMGARNDNKYNNDRQSRIIHSHLRRFNFTAAKRYRGGCNAIHAFDQAKGQVCV